MDVRKTPKAYICWGFYNCGILCGTRRTRKDAIAAAAEYETGKAYNVSKDYKEYMEIHKVSVSIVKK